MLTGAARAAINALPIADRRGGWHIPLMDNRLINNRVTTTTLRTG